MFEPMTDVVILIVFFASNGLFWLLGYFACRQRYSERGVFLVPGFVVIDKTKNKAGTLYAEIKGANS
jgi:hypothetical protein